jgi:hypothetical protein
MDNQQAVRHETTISVSLKEAGMYVIMMCRIGKELIA